MNETVAPVETGAVKWFNSVKGYGFLKRELEGADPTDCFFHATDAKKCGIDEKTIEEGHKFSFQVLKTPRGIKAANLTRLPD